jgi:Ni/Co efflux regulator RcnB
MPVANPANKTARRPTLFQPEQHTMKKKSALSLCLALLLATSGSSFAQGNSQHQRYNNDCRDGRCEGPDNRQPRHPGYAQQHRQPRPDMQQSRDWGERGAGPNHSFYRGDRLPPQYRGRQYVVNDWRGHHLNAPPRGYQWVQNGGDYILVAIATGVILQLLLNN